MTKSIREKGKERRRERIVAAAHRLIARGGLELLSTRRLAEEAELSVHTLYTLVGNRDEIINAVMEENQRRVNSSLHGTGQSYGLGSIFAFVDTTHDILRDDEAAQKPLMKALMQLYESGLASAEIDAMMAQELGWFVLSVKAAIKQGLLQNLAGAEALAASLMRAFAVNLREYLFDRIDLGQFRLQARLDISLLLAGAAGDAAREPHLQEVRRCGRQLRAAARKAQGAAATGARSAS